MHRKTIVDEEGHYRMPDPSGPFWVGYWVIVTTETSIVGSNTVISVVNHYLNCSARVTPDSRDYSKCNCLRLANPGFYFPGFYFPTG